MRSTGRDNPGSPPRTLARWGGSGAAGSNSEETGHCDISKRRAEDNGQADSDPHKPLRQDVRLLGELLGETLRTHAGEPVFEPVEHVRALAKSARAGDDRDFGELAAVLASLPVDAAIPLARAFTHFLNLANVAEQHHRIRRRRAYLRDPRPPPQRGSCDETFARLVAGGVTRERPVRRGLRAADRAGADRAPDRGVAPHADPQVQPHRRAAGRARPAGPDDARARGGRRRRCAARSSSAWETDEVRQQRPTPLDEVRSGLIVFEQSLWHALPRYVRERRSRAARRTGRALPLDAAPVRFGSWIGGDRDGNPNVTPRGHAARRACCRAGWRPISILQGDRRAARRAVDDARHAGAARARRRRARSRIASCCASVRATAAWPTRDWIEASLQADRELPPPDGRLSRRRSRSREPLRLCHDSLVATGDALIADGRLPDVLRRVAAFGVTLARLDIRQEADRHTEALDAITRALGLGSYAEWDEAARGSSSWCASSTTRGRSIPPGLDGDAGGAGRARHVPDDCPHPSRVARRLRHHDDARRRRTCWPSSCCRRRRGVPRPLRVVPLLRDRPPTCGARRHVLDRLLAIDVVSRPDRRAARR